MISVPLQAAGDLRSRPQGRVSGRSLSPSRVASAPVERVYRLIDPLQQPHPQLDGVYDTLDEALRDAIRWLEGLGPGAACTAVGLEVSTRCGNWRTIRHPDLLLCPLASPA